MVAIRRRVIVRAGRFTRQAGRRRCPIRPSRLARLPTAEVRLWSVPLPRLWRVIALLLPATLLNMAVPSRAVLTEIASSIRILHGAVAQRRTSQGFMTVSLPTTSAMVPVRTLAVRWFMMSRLLVSSADVCLLRTAFRPNRVLAEQSISRQDLSWLRM